MPDFEDYQSPFSWRYGSAEMRSIWGEKNKRLTWRKLWVAMAEAQGPLKMVTSEQLQDLKAHMGDVNVIRALEIERTIRHDLMAELKAYAEQCPKGGGILHLGATSMDIKDNAEVLLIGQSLDGIIGSLRKVIRILAEKIEMYANLPVMAFTHLQPAEPTTLGYRLAGYAQDFLKDLESITNISGNLKGKGFKGAVGNAASYVELYGTEGYQLFEDSLSQALGLPFFEISSQTYTRKQDYEVMAALAGLASTAHKFAFDLRILQSQVIGEMAEPFGNEQVGSSAMPFKRNPVEAEKIGSLARAVSTAPVTAWNNYANSLLERTLDDSANRRTLIPEAFLAVDEILITLLKVLDGLKVNETAIKENLMKYGPFAGIERVMMRSVKAGADRQEMHELLRQVSMSAWEEIEQGKPNRLVELVKNESRIACWFKDRELEELFAVEKYTGIAESRSRELAELIRETIS
jgi:adenylosuccinate lyase